MLRCHPRSCSDESRWVKMSQDESNIPCFSSWVVPFSDILMVLGIGTRASQPSEGTWCTNGCRQRSLQGANLWAICFGHEFWIHSHIHAMPLLYNGISYIIQYNSHKCIYIYIWCFLCLFFLQKVWSDWKCHTVLPGHVLGVRLQCNCAGVGSLQVSGGSGAVEGQYGLVCKAADAICSSRIWVRNKLVMTVWLSFTFLAPTIPEYHPWILHAFDAYLTHT